MISLLLTHVILQRSSEKELKACGFFEQYKKMEDAMDAWDREHPDDWHTCDCGENMSALGLNCLSASTEY